MKTVSKACKELMIYEPFYGLFFMTLNKIFDSTIPTACVCTNGINVELRINKEFWYSLPDNIKLGVIKHELMHLCFFHLFQFKEYENKKLFNICADIVVNNYIKSEWRTDEFITVDTFPYLNLDRGRGVKYYYEKLLQNLQSDNPDLVLKNLSESYDAHTSWKEILDSIGEEFGELVKSQLEHQLKDCVNNTKDRGTIPGELKYIIDEIFKDKKPIFDWKKYFRRFLGSSFNIYTKKSYRIESNRFKDSAGLKIKKKHNILVAVDTSGSISNEELCEFFNEIYYIWKTGSTIEIIECDAIIQRHYKYNGKFSGEVSGRGGTHFKPVIDFYNKYYNKYTVLVFFTDGYGEPEIERPYKRMMWIVSSNGKKDRDYYPGFKIQIPKINK